jgi:hypothetical protein
VTLPFVESGCIFSLNGSTGNGDTAYIDVSGKVDPRFAGPTTLPTLLEYREKLEFPHFLGLSVTIRAGLLI